MSDRLFETDFVCVGGGLGGLAGGFFAKELGLDVIVLEKSDQAGGVGAYSGGVVWVPVNHLMAEAGLADSIELARKYLGYLGGNGKNFYHDRRLREAYLQNISRVIQYLAEDGGLRIEMTGLQDQYYPQAPGSSPEGRSLEAIVLTEDLGAWTQRIRRSPYCPPGRTHRQDATELVGGRQIAYGEGGVLPPLPTVLTKGMGLVGSLIRAGVIDREIPYELSVKVTSLIQEGDEIVGVRAISPAGALEVRARLGVLLSTGSYGYAPYAAAMEGLPQIDEQAPPIIDGDVLDLTDPTAAALVRSGNAFVTVGFKSSTLTHPGTDVPLHLPLHNSLGLPHCIVVNPRADRFADESFYGTFASSITRFDGHSKTFPNFPPYLIMDDQYKRRYGGISSLGYWPTEDLVCAGSIAELAELLDLPANRLLATVDRFNNHCSAGVDADFGRGTLAIAKDQYGDSNALHPNLGRLEEPPFWGTRLGLLGVGIYSHGLSIDANARVLTRDGSPVGGLYATGNAVAYTELPFGYESGFANGRNIVYAALAAEHASGNTLGR